MGCYHFRKSDFAFITDGGFDRTIGALGKPGAQYSRASQQSKLGLELRDIAGLTRLTGAKRYRRALRVSAISAVLTTASDGGGSTGGGGSDAPDECSASVTAIDRWRIDR